MGLKSMLIVLGGVAVLSAASSAQELQTTISHFSGKPVPRFESLRYSAVNGREGPSRNDRILWRYEREGLPVLIVKETEDWRRVRDPDGDEVWMHARMLSTKRTAILRKDTSLLRRPHEDARQLAQIQSGVVVALENCDGAWCSVKAGRRSGFVSRLSIWGDKPSEAGV